MALREPYRGYVLQADPVRHPGGRWAARVLIELHHGCSVHYQSVSAEPEKTYPTKEEAEHASIAFGKLLLDSRPSKGAA